MRYAGKHTSAEPAELFSRLLHGVPRWRTEARA